MRVKWIDRAAAALLLAKFRAHQYAEQIGIDPDDPDLLLHLCLAATGGDEAANGTTNDHGAAAGGPRPNWGCPLGPAVRSDHTRGPEGTGR